MTDNSVGGTTINGGGRPSKAFRKGRTCSHENCATVLSIYNKGKFCYEHEPMQTPRTRGRKIA